MKNSSKILLGFMLVMMICCVSAVSATDINSTDDAIITDEIAVDDVSEIVEDVEIDDASDSVVEDDNVDDTQDKIVNEGNLRGTSLVIGTNNYTNYFDANGNFNDSSVDDLTFDGNFGPQSYGNFKFNQEMNITSTPGSTFTNVGFDLIGPRVTVNGGTFIFNESTNVVAGLNVTGTEGKIQNTIINVIAPESKDFYAIDVESASNVKLLNNIITYTCNYGNNESFNYVIKAKNSADLKIKNNTITANLPLKTVNWNLSGSIDADYVAGIAIENCNNVRVEENTMVVNGRIRAGDYPTLDAIIIANCNDAHIEWNKINESDLVTVNNQYSYIYAIDVYSCNNIHIAYNTVNMNGNKSDDHIEGDGTGAAYCIQLSGFHQGVNIYYNNLTTINEGSNLGIYSQNYAEQQTHLTIYGNNIDVTGKAGSGSWDLLSGIETQDYHAEIYNNNIHVNNTASYVQGNYAFGISYAQWINGTHYAYIHNNTVEVINGDYAVYLIPERVVTGEVTENTLIAYTGSGNNTADNAVSAGSKVNVENNH